MSKLDRSSLGWAVAEVFRVPLVQTSIQSRAAFEGLLSDDGTPTGPLSAAHGALDGGRPVLVCAVFTGPLGNQLAHRRAAAVGGSPPLRGALSSANPLSRRAHSRQRTVTERETKLNASFISFIRQLNLIMLQDMSICQGV